MSKPRIAIASFQHETNCFAGPKAGLAEFEMADSWPEMLHGARVLKDTAGMNLPTAGFAKAGQAAGFEIIPVLWCSAEPSAQVTDQAFEQIMQWILAGIRAAMPLDGIFLDLHGAMVTESFADGEGEILRRVREVIGPDLPLVISLDLHANISQTMVDLSDFMGIFRTYPHLDMAETGARCVPVMAQLLQGRRLCKAFAQIPYLIPLHSQFTGQPPFSDLYNLLPMIEVDGLLADIALGFTAADFPDTGPSCVAYADDQPSADSAIQAIERKFQEIRPLIKGDMLSLDQAATLAHAVHSKPLILADVQDNPGAGGSSDTTGLLWAMIHAGAKDVLMGLFHDPEVAQIAHDTGVGQQFRAELGGKSGLPGQRPAQATFEVLSLSAGHCTYSGEMYGGGVATLGPSAALRTIGGAAQIDLVVTSIRNQCLDLAQFTHFGLDPARYNVVCVKSTVHFRAAFDPIASDVKPVSSPGGFLCDLAQIPYKSATREILRF